MAIMIKLAAVVVILGVYVQYGLCQRFPTNIVGFGKTLGKGPPIANIRNNKDRLANLKKRLGVGSLGGLRFSECNLRRVTPFKDASIVGTTAPGGRNGNAVSTSMLTMALNRAIGMGGANAAAARSLRDNARKVLASEARAKAQDKSRARKKRQSPDVSFLAETMTTELCRPKEKLVTSVMNEGDKCWTILPQEVKFWECASPLANGMANAYPTLQAYHCEPADYAFTSWFVICPIAKPGTDMLRMHTAHVPVNCACLRYKCNFDPYQSSAPRRF